MSEDIKRAYVKTPKLVQTGVQLPPTPQSPEQFDELRRLLDALKAATHRSDGVTSTVVIGGATLIFDRGILISIS